MNEQSTAYQKLPPELQAITREALDATAQMLNEYAGMMERGDIPSLDGPDALRLVARYLNLALIRQEGTNG